MSAEQSLGRLGKYELLRELGRGAFGTVYLARDTLLEVERALKVLHPYLVHDETLQARFRREAQVAARLEHPHIVPVYEFGEVEGKFYLAMRYMAGGSLKARLKREGRLPWAEVVRITREIAEGLAYAHAQGVVHRDLKPSNILFDQAGRAAIGDFGFAKVVGEGGTHLSLTGTGGMIGTPAYMAPEVWQGKEVGPAADQYALACLVVEMLTGEVLFGGETPWEIMTKHVLETPPLPESLPDEAKAVLQKALAKDAGERYASVMDFVEALAETGAKEIARAAAEATSVRALAERIAQVKAAMQAGKWEEAWQGVAVIQEEAPEEGARLGKAVVEARLAAEKEGLAERMRAEGVDGIKAMLNEVQAWGKAIGQTVTWKGWDAHVLGLLGEAIEARAWEAGRGWLEILQMIAPARVREGEQIYWEGRHAAAAESKDWAMVVQAARRLLALEEGTKTAGKEETVRGSVPEPGGRTEATATASAPSRLRVAGAEVERSEREVLVLQPQGGWWQWLLGMPPRIYSVAFSPDGALLASGADDKMVRLWRVADGSLMRALEGHEEAVWSVAFSPDGTLLASGSDDKTVRLWLVADGGLVRILKGHTDPVHSVAFSPDGALLASGSGDKTVRLWRVADGSLVRTLEGHTGTVWSVAFSPDGTLLASGSGDRTVRLWRVADGALMHILKEYVNDVLSVAFSPDGALLASGADDKTVRLWRVVDGSLVRVRKGHTSSVRGVAFSPDGALLASGSGDKTVRLWRVADGSLVRTLQGHTGWVHSVAFSPDGTLLASGSGDGTVRLWGAVASSGGDTR